MPYEPVVKVAASVKATRVRWLWPKYVARGQVTILDGDPGTGKSFITMDLAARVSRGDVMPGGRYKGDPEPVLVCNAEDDEERRSSRACGRSGPIWTVSASCPAFGTRGRKRPSFCPTRTTRWKWSSASSSRP